METLTENQQNILDRAVATAANSATKTAWILEDEDGQRLISLGLLKYVENSRYGKMIRVKLND